MSTYVHFVTFKADGLPQAGLSPTAKARGAGGVDLSGSMAIAEVGDGIYSVTYTYTTAVPCRAVINAGTDVIDNRSIDVDFTLAELNGAASAVQTADNNVILADATKGLAKVYDAMARADAVGPSLSTITSTMALDSTVAKEATLTTKIPTALSFTGANVNAESKVTAAPADMATASNQADILEAIAAVPAAPSAAAIDTQLSGTHGSGIWGASGGGGGSSAEDIDIRLTAYHGAGTWAGTNKVSVSYPLTPDVDMSIVRGDDYNNSDSRAITFTLTNAPNLTGAAIKLYANMPTVFEKSMTVVTGGTGTQVVRLELSATETAAFTVGTFGYDIRAVLVTSLRVVTLISRSKLIVTEKIA
jgi:hypothetical protein